MTYGVIYSPKARAQLAEIYDYIVTAGSTARAAFFIQELIAACDALHIFPNRGRRRDDLRAGLRAISFRKRVTILFEVGDDRVNILGIFYAGREYEAALQTDDE